MNNSGFPDGSSDTAPGSCHSFRTWQVKVDRGQTYALDKDTLFTISLCQVCRFDPHSLRAIAEFDRREAWGWGFQSTAHWLAWRVGIDLVGAREKVRVARALEAAMDALRQEDSPPAPVIPAQAGILQLQISEPGQSPSFRER